MATCERSWRPYRGNVRAEALIHLARRATQAFAPGFDPPDREMDSSREEENLGEGWVCYKAKRRYGTEEQGFAYEEEETITGDSLTPQPDKFISVTTAYGMPAGCAFSLTIHYDWRGPIEAAVKMEGPNAQLLEAERILNSRFNFDNDFLVLNRTYRASEVSLEQLQEALAEGRVLVVNAGSRAYGTGDVWFTIASPEDGESGPPNGIILPEPITQESLAAWNNLSWDSEGEFWEFQDNLAITQPCQQMTAEQRFRFKQAVALLIAYLIEEMLPFTLSASAAPYIVLLRQYTPEMAQRVVDCARETGWNEILFDQEQKWETEGRIEPVEPYLRKELPRTLGEYMLSDRVAAFGATGHHDVWAAQGWLAAAIRRWVTDTAWKIVAWRPVPYIFAEGKVFPDLRTLKPALFSEFRAPARPELEQRLHALLGKMDAKQAASFRRYCIWELIRRLKLLPELPAGLPALLEAARSQAGEDHSEKAGSLAEEATKLGGDALFALPFRLMALQEPQEIASKMVEAARNMATRQFAALTNGLRLWPTREQVEQAAGEKAVDAMLEEMRRYVQRAIFATE